MSAKSKARICTVFVMCDDGTVRKEPREYSAEEMRQTQKRINERWEESPKMPYRPMNDADIMEMCVGGTARGMKASRKTAVPAHA